MEEVVNSPSDVERGQLQTLSQTREGVALDGGRWVHPPSKEHVVDQKLLWQEVGELGILTLIRTSLGMLQQNHHHVHGEQTMDHLQRSEQ